MYQRLRFRTDYELTGEYVHPPMESSTFRFLSISFVERRRSSLPVLLLHQVYRFKAPVKVCSFIIPTISLIVNLSLISFPSLQHMMRYSMTRSLRDAGFWDSPQRPPKYHLKLQFRFPYWYSQTHSWYEWVVEMEFVEVGIYVHKYPCSLVSPCSIFSSEGRGMRMGIPIDLSSVWLYRTKEQTYKIPDGLLITHHFLCWTWEMLFEFMNDSRLTQDPTQTYE